MRPLRVLFFSFVLIGASLAALGGRAQSQESGALPLPSPSSPAATTSPGAHPVVFWGGIGRVETITGPVRQVIIYYDPYRWFNPQILGTQGQLSEAKIDALVQAFAAAAGTSIPSIPGVGASAASLGNTPVPNTTPMASPQPSPEAAGTPLPMPTVYSAIVVSPHDGFYKLSADVNVIVHNVRDMSYRYAVDLSILQSMKHRLQSQIFDDEATLATMNSRVFESFVDQRIETSFAKAGTDDETRGLMANLRAIVRTSDKTAICVLQAIPEIAALERQTIEETDTSDCPSYGYQAINVHDAEKMADEVDAIDSVIATEQFGDRTKRVKASSLNKEQVSYLRGNLAKISVSDYLPGGAKLNAYVQQVQSIASIAIPMTRVHLTTDFEKVSTVGDCGRGNDSSDLAFFGVDRLNSDQSKASVTSEVLRVNCYPRSYVAVGAGVAFIRDQVYARSERDYLTNGGGPPPAPAPSFQPIYRISAQNQNARLAGYALYNTCFCLHPTDGWNAFWTLGFGVSNQNPQLIAGFSAGHSRDVFMTLGGVVGYRSILGDGNNLNDLVNSNYNVTTNKRLQGGFGLVFSFPVLNGH